MERNFLKQKRKEKGLTQYQLAEMTGVSRAQIANIEQGKYFPSLRTAKEIAKALDTTVENLF